MNCSGGRAAARSRRFQTASPASHSPGLRPMRGSGLGAPDDEEAGAPVVVTDACEQAPMVASAATASPTRTRAYGDFLGTAMSDVIRSVGEVKCMVRMCRRGASSRARLEQDGGEHLPHARDLAGLI